jgi:nucleoside-diphosphate-sugar epimerase
VGDTCQALLAALEAPLDAVMGEVINLATGRGIDILTVARTILDQLEGDAGLITHIANRPGQVDLHVGSTDKAQRLLGWRATTSLEEGLARTVDWYRRNEAWWRKRVWMRHVQVTVPDGQKVLH